MLIIFIIIVIGVLTPLWAVATMIDVHNHVPAYLRDDDE